MIDEAFFLSRGNKMKKFKAIAASTKPDLNGMTLSLENLKTFEGHCAPIVVGYDICSEVGKVTKAYVENELLIVEGELEDYFRNLPKNNPLSIGVSFACEMDENLKYTEVRPSYYGLISDPSDTGTKPIEEIKE